jgi:ketosteroid isomerase-like protein
MSAQVEEIVREAFAAVDTRDDDRLDRVLHPDVSFHWPESLRPHNFHVAGEEAARSWDELWEPFQPRTQFPTRQMQPRVVASSDTEVAVLWHQRAINADREYLDCEVLGLYEVRERRLYRAQMFYFDAVNVRRFLRSRKPA